MMEPFDFTDKQNFLKMEIFETLRQVIDPELEINIVDMGLVYGATINQEEQSILIKMTLSSPGCPMGGAITGAVENCMEHHYPHYKTTVHLVWEPAWNYELISEEGKRLLGM